MKVHTLHGWEVSVGRAKEIQLSLAKRVVTENEVTNVSKNGTQLSCSYRFSLPFSAVLALTSSKESAGS
jgi:hypothetical protein